MTRFIQTIVTLLFFHSGLFACTIFNVSGEGKILIGNNEDWRYTNSYVKFIPAGKNKFGRVIFGFGKNCRYVFGGINDKGLFYDIASLPVRDDIVFDSQKKTVDNNIYEKMLETCSDIDEAVEFLKGYNINGFKRHHIMIVDKTGNSAIVEWGIDSLSVLRKSKDYQVMTNFNNTLSILSGRYHDGRFKKVEDQIVNSQNSTVDDVRKILESVKNSGGSYPTVYSNIYDLVDNKIYLYNYHNFEEYYTIDINEALNKNGHSFFIPSIFSNLILKEPETVSDNEVELKWQGNANRYKLYISTASDFNSCIPIDITDASYSTENKSNIVFLLLFFFPFCLFLIKNKKLQISTCALFIFLVLAANCTNSKEIRENKEYSYSFLKLETNKTYYWKVQAIKNNDLKTNSITKQFSISKNIHSK